MLRRLIALSALFGWLFYSLPTHQVGYLLVFPVTIVWAFGFAVVVANQVAFWMANHPKVHWEVSRLWESFLPRLKSWTVPSDCPEIRSVQVAPVLLLVSFGVGWLVVLQLERSIAWEFAALLGMFELRACSHPARSAFGIGREWVPGFRCG